jgi:D-alanyl-D-alanine carboxypeptidase
MKRVAAILALLITFASISLGNTKALGQASKAECVMEMNSRRILYELHGDMRLPMASTTKIVTAVAILENAKNIKEEVSIPKEATAIEGSSAYLKVDERYTIEDLLYGLMLRSGNDCATALALHCSRNLRAFSLEMNRIAQKAGALQSNFQNPHGLPAEEHYTTARDLTAISCYAMQNQTFRKIVSTRYYEPYHWRNKNKMLTQYEGAIGIKTGYTKEAGRCLVSAAERNGMTLVCTLLNCPTTYERTEKLLDDAFSSYKMKKLLSCGQEFKVQSTIGVVREEFFYPLLEGEIKALEYLITPIKNKVDEEIIGHLKISLAKRLLFSTNLYKL